MRLIHLFPVWIAVFLASCSTPTTAPGEIDPDLLLNFRPAPAAMESEKNPLTDAKVTLGRMLFYEKRLSRDRNISCNSCHDLAAYGVDRLPVSKGHGGQTGRRNAPTVYHSAGHTIQFWDGRAADVEEQAVGPILNPVEMAMASSSEVEQVLRSIPEYAFFFRKAFPGEKQPVTLENAARAIGAFERKLVTPSRWDKFLDGDRDALSAEEKAGFIAFFRAGCPSCHNGPYLGGRLYQKLGLVKPWPRQDDQGRFEITRQEHDRMVFKAPSLRNVEKTAPYFHDGSVESLEQAVRLMAEHQVERPLTETETRGIAAWLMSLTGELPLDYIRPPSTPAGNHSGPEARGPRLWERPAVSSPGIDAPATLARRAQPPPPQARLRPRPGQPAR
jgi:cytochrome c peroxidase